MVTCIRHKGLRRQVASSKTRIQPFGFLGLLEMYLTNKVYTNADPAIRQAINTMAAGDWLRIRFVDKRGKNIQ